MRCLESVCVVEVPMIAADGNGAFLARRRRVAHIVSLDAFIVLTRSPPSSSTWPKLHSFKTTGARAFFYFYALDDFERLNYI